MTLTPPERNAVFVAVQAAMLAVTRSDPAAARRCLEIALDELKAWNKMIASDSPYRT